MSRGMKKPIRVFYNELGGDMIERYCDEEMLAEHRKDEAQMWVKYEDHVREREQGRAAALRRVKAEGMRGGLKAAEIIINGCEGDFSFALFKLKQQMELEQL